MAEQNRLKAAALQQVPGLAFERPIVFFDLETTGFNAREDRIVELACLKVHPNRQVGIPSAVARRAVLMQHALWQHITCGSQCQHPNQVHLRCSLAGTLAVTRQLSTREPTVHARRWTFLEGAQCV
jgi:DNA polymerase III epsilon subunit-like protein